MKPIHPILIIEDDPEISGWINEKLTRYNFNGSVNIIDTLTDALKIMEETLPDAIILDLTLPDGNGIDVLKKINNKKLPIKVFVFSVNNGMRNVCLRMGADGFYDKSCDGERLIETVLNVANKSL